MDIEKLTQKMKMYFWKENYFSNYWKTCLESQRGSIQKSENDNSLLKTKVSRI